MLSSYWKIAMPAKILYSDLWFDEVFSDPESGKPYEVPADIRKFSEFLCREKGIEGSCDPMYIANITALELGYGDGRSHFYTIQPGVAARRETYAEDVLRLAERLHHSYGTVFAARQVGVMDLVAIIRGRLREPGAMTWTDRFEKILGIAERVQPLEDRYVEAWQTFDAVPTMEGYRTFVKAVAKINAEIEKEIPLLADLTENSISNMRTFAPRDEANVWFNTQRPAEFLRKVAKYQSFNEEYWRGRERLNKEEAAAQAAIATARPKI